MLQLPRSFHPDFRQTGVKPVGPVEIDWTHPMAADLVFYAIGPQELVTGAVAAPVDAFGSTLSAHTYGRNGFQFESHSITNGGFWFKYNGKGLDGALFLTIATLVSLDSASTNGKFFVVPVDLTSWVSLWINLSWGRKDGGTQAGFEYTPGGVLSKSFSDTDFLVFDGDPRMYSVSKNDTITTRFYRDGQLWSENTRFDHDQPVEYSTAQQHVFALSRNDAATGEGVNGRMAVCAAWRREFTKTDHAEFYADPYALLKPSTPAAYFTPAAAGVPLDNDLISAMHFQRHYEPIPEPGA